MNASHTTPTHETRTVAVEESEGQVVEERPGPVGLADRITAQQERARHAALLLVLLGLLFLLAHAGALRHRLTPFHGPMRLYPRPLLGRVEMGPGRASSRQARRGTVGPCDTAAMEETP